MANEFKILVKYKEHSFEISNNNPDFSAIVDYFLLNLDSNVSDISVECEDKEFDSNILKETIIESISEFKDLINEQISTISTIEKNINSQIDDINSK